MGPGPRRRKDYNSTARQAYKPLPHSRDRQKPLLFQNRFRGRGEKIKEGRHIEQRIVAYTKFKVSQISLITPVQFSTTFNSDRSEVGWFAPKSKY